jgi:hypothetical protein
MTSEPMGNNVAAIRALMKRANNSIIRVYLIKAQD